MYVLQTLAVYTRGPPGQLSEDVDLGSLIYFNYVSSVIFVFEDVGCVCSKRN